MRVNMTTTVTIDIETIPSQQPGLLKEIRAGIKPPGNISKPESIEKWMQENAQTAANEAWLKTALNGAAGEIICIGYAIEDSPVKSIHRNLGDCEATMLARFFGDLAGELDSPPLYVGHNIHGFDLRFIFQRAVIHGVKPPFPLHHDARYNDLNKSYDTMLAWAGWGNRCKLADICKALGIKVKSDGIDGSQVWPYVQTGRVQEVATYCEEDVTATREVFRRLTFAGVTI